MAKAKHEEEKEEKTAESHSLEKRVEDLVKGLEWIRDNWVHGNDAHVKEINNMIRGQ